MPKADVCRKISTIHLKRRGMDIKDLDLQQLQENSDGFSGTEIEQKIASALYCTQARNQPPPRNCC